ncbi:SDR family NAD(P)-dependent oxidoreductase [Streptomyces sp. bgisy084]|uniref:SDR family NAD(P)-dependent oxidoreductase n=1 Tax=Streptomyces sp. bgisy084 TaxID=3413777 RepID=UPI003D75B3C9
MHTPGVRCPWQPSASPTTRQWLARSTRRPRDSAGWDRYSQRRGRHRGDTSEGRFEAHRAAVDVYLLGATATIDAAVTHSRRQRGGQAVGIAPVAAAFGVPGGSLYSASKAGLTRYLQSLRGGLWKNSITVTTIAPGYIAPPINEPLGDKRPFLIGSRTGLEH